MERSAPVSIYITGFGPFQGVEDNPSSSLCETLRKYVHEGLVPELVPQELLQEFQRANMSLEGLRTLDVAAEACQAEVPKIISCLKDKCSTVPNMAAAIVHLGVAGDRAHISLECRGVNEANFRIPDAYGWNCCGEPVVERSKPVLYSSFRLPEILAELQDRGINCAISTDAGRYICNYIFFQSLHAAQPLDIPVLFVHIPAFENMDEPSQVTGLLCLFIAIARQLRGDAPWVPVASKRPLG
mmetsp:Transcript_62280/g.116571  ORF Transcript_62280/g.116571 Transcript_62280/m.116571 type:complete len:242 (-) Transcript_62280:30-755(-)